MRLEGMQQKIVYFHSSNLLAFMVACWKLSFVSLTKNQENLGRVTSSYFFLLIYENLNRF